MNAIQRTILIKLCRRCCWGAKHTSFENLPKGFPKHLRGQVKNEAEELIRRGYLMKKPISYGLEVSLNPAMKFEIDEITRE
ncbi:MAG: hypothetical protein V1911_01260 [Candidatus Micrarchaeota archaeon]